MKMSIIEITDKEIVEKRKNLTLPKAERVTENMIALQPENLYLCFETREVKEWGLPIIYASI